MGQFEVRDEGLFQITDGQPHRIAPPIYVDARTHDVNGEFYGNLVRFADPEGHQRNCVLLYSELMEGNEAIKRMANLGFRPTNGRKALEGLRNYCLEANPATTICTVPSHGWHNDEFIDNDSFDIAEQEGQSVTILDPNVAGGHRYNTAGTLEDWKASVGRLAAGNSRIVFTISAAFAAALLEPLRQPNIGLHLHGISSIGKTTTLYAAGSVWGGGGGGANNLGFVQSWRSTANGLELACALHNDSILCLDEISLVNEKDIGDIVYALGNGIGKRRATRDIRSRPVIQFRLVFLSCGERSLQEMMAAAGRRSRGGQESRLIDVPADPGHNRGIFETLHEHANGAALSQCLTLAAKTNYGTPSRAFTRHLVKNRDEAIAEAKSLQSKFVSQLKLPETAAGEVYRVANTVGLIAGAGEMVTRLGYTGWDPEEHLSNWAANVCFTEWRMERGGTFEAHDVQAGVRAVSHFLSRYAYRFANLNSPPITMPDRAGFWEEEPQFECRRYYIFREVFVSEICKEFNHRMILDALQSHQCLVVNEGDRYTYQKKIVGEGKIRFYAVLSTICEKF